LARVILTNWSKSKESGVAGRGLSWKIYTTWGVKFKTSFNLIVQEVSILIQETMIILSCLPKFFFGSIPEEKKTLYPNSGTQYGGMQQCT